MTLRAPILQRRSDLPWFDYAPVVQRSIALLSGPQLQPFAQTDWPLPIPVRRIDYAPAIQPSPGIFVRVQLPFNQFDWPLPIPVRRIDYAPATQPPTALNAGPQILPVGRLQDWPNPTLLLKIDYAPTPPYNLVVASIIPPVVIAGIYRLLADHYLLSGYAPAGTIVTEGQQIPFGWIPTIASEPLNSVAIQKFWNTGPTAQKDAEPLRDRFWSAAAIFSNAPPVIYWTTIGNGLWQLTGAGASLGPKGGQ